MINRNRKWRVRESEIGRGGGGSLLMKYLNISTREGRLGYMRESGGEEVGRGGGRGY